MCLFHTTIILRHGRENLKKCTLRGLEERSDFRFFTYPTDALPDLSQYILLTLDAPPLSVADRNLSVFLIDGTWRYAHQMQKQLKEPHLFQKRSLPAGFRTAYPRRQADCPEPSRGLSSIEALYLSFLILGKSTEGLLDNYHWSKEFLELNSLIIKEKCNLY